MNSCYRMRPACWVSLLWFFLSVQALAQCRIIDLDLTQGPPRDNRVRVEGGTWQDGWRVSGDLDRLVLDAGYQIKNGYFEVVVTRAAGVAFTERKRNWMGLAACEDMNQCPGGYARAGGEGYSFSKAEIFAAYQPHTICEKTFGTYADWVLDDRTEHTVRAEIRNGVMTWSNRVGERHGQTACGSEAQPVTQFRYAAVGGILAEKKGWHHGSLLGLRVRRAVVVDLDKPAGCPAVPVRTGRVVFDTDLTKGPAAFTGTVRGGTWANGWRVTGDDQRLVWDAGRPIPNGTFEYWLTTPHPPVSPLREFRGKVHHPDVHWAGVSGVAELAALQKHTLALRLGQNTEGPGRGHGWSKIVVLGPDNEGETEKTEQVMGDYAWWKPLADGRRVIHVKLEWNDGVASLYLPDGTRTSCPLRGKGGRDVRISNLRYAWVGGVDEEFKSTFPGMTFLRARLTEWVD